MDKTIVVTGGFGFLGSHIVKSLIDNGSYNIIVIEKKLSNNIRLKGYEGQYQTLLADEDDLSLLSRKGVFGVIHTATDYGRNSGISAIVKNNILFPLELLEIFHEPVFFINMDSYFNKRGENLNYLGEYILSKKHLIEWLQRSKNHTIINLKLEHLYGLGDSPQKFVYMIINSLLNNEKSIKLTSGNQKRDFIHVKDVTSLISEIADKIELFNEKYNEIEVGWGTSISIKQFVESAKSHLGNRSTELLFGHIPERENEIMESKADLSKMPDFLEWKPEVDLKTGLSMFK